jgi:hypothetical protein
MIVGYEQQSEMAARSREWQTNATAPRDGTVIEYMNTYGVAPTYGLIRWTDEHVSLDQNNARRVFKGSPSWERAEPDAIGGTPIDTPTLLWRPFHGDPAHYIDPTGGAQNDAAYWRGAVAAKYGLAPNAFEAIAERNHRRNERAAAKPKRSLMHHVRRVLGMR